METRRHMFEVTKYPEATFCWADLSTPDTAAGKAFYTALFGWDHEDRLVGDGVYGDPAAESGPGAVGRGGRSQ
jgi:hypothetical protein